MAKDGEADKAKRDAEEALRKAMREEAERAKVKPGLARILRHTHWKVTKDKGKGDKK